MVRVTLTPEAQRQLVDLPAPIRARMYAVIARIQRWPDVSGAKPLRGQLAGRHRIRTGDYRMQFYLSGDEVIVEKIGHRDGFYD
jgi:mRNA-degrading endonuclease RelE of RelBE toxin-antitoxin system